LVNVLVDSPNPGAVLQAAHRLYAPVERVVISPEMAVPMPLSVEPIIEEAIPPLASQKVSLGPWSRTMFNLVREEADRGNVAPAFILAIVHEESRFNPLAVNPSSGALGLGQLMPATAEQHGVRDPFDPRQNVRGVIAHVKHLASRVDSPTTILAAYRAGLGNVRRRGISQNDWAYVRRVVTHWRMYERLLKEDLIHEDPIGTILIFKKP
jgi:soluble lytic murein transglycosylase-like protein